jgi:hypothetical protein
MGAQMIKGAEPVTTAFRPLQAGRHASRQPRAGRRRALLRAGARVPDVTAGPTVLMADVSEFEPDVDDPVYLAWSKAMAIRALYGDAHDDAAWYGGARRAALHAGGALFMPVYQCLVAGQSGTAQAQAFKQLVGAIRPGEVFVADFEEGQHAMLTAWYNEMLALYGQGIAPWLWTYTGLSFGQDNSALPVQWLADYTAVEPSSRHTLWQFTSSYQVPGVGTADCSLFHGTISQLAALAYPAAPPPAWAFSPVRGLTVSGLVTTTQGVTEYLGVGPHSVKAAWWAPSETEPEALDHYQVTVRHQGEDVAAPVNIAATVSPAAVACQWNNLTPGLAYELFVRACAADGHASPWATVIFTTPAA